MSSDDYLLLFGRFAESVAESMDRAWMQMRLGLLDSEDELPGLGGFTRVMLHHRQGRKTLHSVPLESEIRRHTVVYNNCDAGRQRYSIGFLLDLHFRHLGQKASESLCN